MRAGFGGETREHGTSGVAFRQSPEQSSESARILFSSLSLALQDVSRLDVVSGCAQSSMHGLASDCLLLAMGGGITSSLEVGTVCHKPNFGGVLPHCHGAAGRQVSPWVAVANGGPSGVLDADSVDGRGEEGAVCCGPVEE